MGVDLLDLWFRLEKRFDTKIPRKTLDEMIDAERGDIQARAVHDAICHLLVSQHKPIPKSSWHRVQMSIYDTLGKSPKEIRPESWLRKDLNASM